MNLAQAKQECANQIRILAERQAKNPRKNIVLRLSFKIDHINLLSWLAHQVADVKIYWSNQESLLTVAGIGVADDIVPPSHPSKQRDVFERFDLLKKNDAMRYFGGFCFDKDNLDDQWKPFGMYRFVIPLIEINYQHNQTELAVNLIVKDGNNKIFSDTLNALDQMITEIDASIALPSVKASVNIPDENVWTAQVKDILLTLSVGTIEKLVLGRKSIVSFSDEINPAAFLKQLEMLAPASSRFLIQFEEHKAFFGASPERLYVRTKNHIQTNAIAGTAPRTGDVIKDKQVKQNLLASDKDLREHQFVVAMILDKMNMLCDHVCVDPQPSILELNHSFHLITKFSGNLKEGMLDSDVFYALHPTPAVAGIPVDQTVKMIADIEPFSRGWFAGPVACITHDDVDMVVAIRSALIDGHTMNVYAGAGIVDGSDPQKEWAEVDNKITNMRRVLGELQE